MLTRVRIRSEHLDRYHSLRYWCSGCKKRFRFNSRDDLAVLKSEHESRCTRHAGQGNTQEWAEYAVMTPMQHSRWSDKKWKKVDIPRLEGETMPRYSWRQIYLCLFPTATSPGGEVLQPSRQGIDAGAANDGAQSCLPDKVGQALSSEQAAPRRTAKDKHTRYIARPFDAKGMRLSPPHDPNFSERHESSTTSSHSSESSDKDLFLRSLRAANSQHLRAQKAPASEKAAPGRSPSQGVPRRCRQATSTPTVWFSRRCSPTSRGN
jgi:hypothetical protein